MLGLDAKRTWSWKLRMCGTGILQRKPFGAIIRGEQMSSEGRSSWMPLKVLLYDDLVGVVTSHVPKMAVIPLDPPWPKPAVVRKHHGSVLYVRSYCRLQFFIPWIGNFGYLLRNMVENIIYFIRTAKVITMIPKHIFWPIIDCFSM